MTNWRTLLALGSALLTTVLTAQPDLAPQRADAAWALARGTLPATPAATTADAAGFAECLDAQRTQLLADAPAAQTVARRAWLHAFGPTREFAATAATNCVTYTEWMTAHLTWLAAHPDARQATIHQAYRHVIGRPAFEIEITYWNQRPPLPYALLVACIDDWALRNQPGLMVTTGLPCVSVNNPHLKTLQLAPAVAAEVQSALVPMTKNEAARAIARGERVLAPGAAGLISVGNIPFLAVGPDTP